MDIQKELKNIKNAIYLCIFSGVLTLIMGIINPDFLHQYFNQEAMIIEAIIILLLTFGLYKKSRTCAVVLFALFVVEFVSKLAINASAGLTLIITYYLLRAMISTFKYHKYKVEFENNPIEINDSEITGKNTVFTKIGVGLIVVLMLIGVATLMLNNESTYSLKDQINLEIEKLNKSAPIMVDDDTRLDSVSIVDDTNIVYKYTLINYFKSGLDIEKIKNMLKPMLVENIVNSDEMKDLKAANYIFTYSYSDKSGALLCDIKITPTDYNK